MAMFARTLPAEDNKHFDDVENRRKTILRSLMAKRTHETVFMTRDAVNVIAGLLSTQLDAPLLYKQCKYAVVSTNDYYIHLKKEQPKLFERITRCVGSSYAAAEVQHEDNITELGPRAYYPPAAGHGAQDRASFYRS